MHRIAVTKGSIHHTHHPLLDLAASLPPALACSNRGVHRTVSAEWKLLCPFAPLQLGVGVSLKAAPRLHPVPTLMLYVCSGSVHRLVALAADEIAPRHTINHVLTMHL